MLLPAILAMPLAMSLALRLTAGGLESPASAEVCGRCHRAIHESWKASTHSQAMESRLFQDVLAMAVPEGEIDGCRRALPHPPRDRVRREDGEAHRAGGLCLSRGRAAAVRTRGFSLVELCVGMILGVVLMSRT